MATTTQTTADQSRVVHLTVADRAAKGEAARAKVPMAIYAQMCAWTLARAHARSGDRVAIGSYLGNSERFDDAIARFARAYAEQNDLDHRALVEGIASGRVAAQSGV